MKTVFVIMWATLLISNQTSAMHNSHSSQLRYTSGSMQDEDLRDYLSPTQRRAAAYLLVEKRLLNKVLVEAMDVIVQYRIYNVGSQTARDIRLRDTSLEDDSKFAVVGGLTNAFLGNLHAGTNTSHTVVVRPKQNGQVEFKAAEIAYSWGEDMVSFGSSTEPGIKVIYSTSAFHRQFSPHFEEWTAFAILSLPSLLIPFMLWFTSKSKNENLVKDSEGIRKKRMCCYRDR